jgi:hypothetical protein
MSNNYQSMQDYFLDQMQTSADDQQVGGKHYTDMGVQPWTLMESILTHAEFVGFLKGNAIKYSMRQGKKEGSDDANKTRHYLSKLKEVTQCHTL